MIKCDKKFIREIDFEYWFDFGKHDGKSVLEVLEEEPSYIVWLYNETNHIVDDDLFDMAEAKTLTNNEWEK